MPPDRTSSAIDLPALPMHARTAAVLVAGAVVFLTLKPFVVRIPTSADVLIQMALSYDRETLQHVVPAAALVALARAGWGIGRVRAAVFVLAGLCVLEGAQAAMEYRHARVGDVLAQTLGIVIGARLPNRALSIRAWRVVWIAVLGAWVALAIGVGVRGQLGHSIGPMSAGYRLLVGDEYGGGRPWLGEVHAFSIGTGAAGGTLVEFGERPPAGPWISRAGLAIELEDHHGGWSSAEPVVTLCRALDGADEIELCIDATPAAARQLGPARLVSISDGPSHRNVTVGHEGNSLILRVRTERSGLNAARPQFVFPDAFHTGVRTRFRVKTDGGSAELWANGEPIATRLAHVTARDWLRLAPGFGDAAGVAALFAPLGLSLLSIGAASHGGGAHRIRPRVWIGAALLPIPIVAVIWSISLLLGRPVSLPLMPGAVAASLFGAAIAAVMGSRC
ncbi:MAG: hypothetical protein AAGJ54_05570 [Planctomycetota bacterium]